jgi:hypothetical protein
MNVSTSSIGRFAFSHRFFGIAGLYVTLIVVAAGLYLFAPTAGGNDWLCGRTVRLGQRLSFPFNCDSPTFINLAIEPSHLLDRDSMRQDRPVYVISAAILSRLLLASGAWRLVPAHLCQNIVAQDAGSDTRRIQQYLCGYLAYILMNGVLLLATLLLFHWLVAEEWSANPIVIGFSAFLLTNDLVKTFFWTPHLQLFNLTVPLASVAIFQHTYRRSSLGILWTGGIGLAVGSLSLTYGSFAICASTAAAAMALRIGWRRDISLGGFVMSGGALIIAFALPTLIWMETCKLVSGNYYNRELIEYHEFVWIIESARQGSAQLVASLTANLYTFLKALLPVVPFPILLFAGVFDLGLLVRAPVLLILSERSDAFIAIVVTILGCFVFFYFTGFYQERLAQNVVIPILLGAAILAVDIVKKLYTPFVTSALSIWALVLIRLAQEIVKPGPWS